MAMSFTPDEHQDPRYVINIRIYICQNYEQAVYWTLYNKTDTFYFLVRVLLLSCASLYV